MQLTHTQRLEMESHKRLVQDYYEDGKKDLESLSRYEQLREWFENKWKMKFIPQQLEI